MFQVEFDNQMNWKGLDLSREKDLIMVVETGDDQYKIGGLREPVIDIVTHVFYH